MRLEIIVLYVILHCTSIAHIHVQKPGQRMKLSEDETEELEKAHRNSICCAKKLRCCDPRPPDIELRAVLTRCPNMGSDTSIITRTMQKPIYPSRDRNIRTFQGFDEDEITVQTDIVECTRKLLLTMNIKNQGKTNCKNQFIVVDHVFDPVSEKSVRILNPYVIKLKQESVTQTYEMEFLDYVNSEAKEEVFNKHDGNFTGCSILAHNATCGIVRYHGKVIPYSHGFCCSCDVVVNAMRQPETDTVAEKIALSDPAYLLDNVHCPRSFFRDSDKYAYYERKRASAENRRPKDQPTNYYNVEYDRETSPRLGYKDVVSSERFLSKKQSRVPKSFRVNKHLENKQSDTYLMHLSAQGEKYKAGYIDKVKKTHKISKHDIKNKLADPNRESEIEREKRQVLSSGAQRRGGQNCADRYTPLGQDPKSYHESAHCLRFSDMWYAVYRVGKPQVAQTLYIEVYEKLVPECGDQARWRDLTRGVRVKLGTFDQTYINDNPSTISMKFSSEFEKVRSEDLFKLDPESRLLIPEASYCEHFVEAKGGPDEYLILRPDQIQFQGYECDKVGIGFEAFYKQGERCAMSRGTCLQNQPKQLWRHDKRLDKKRLKGCYFLKHYAAVPPDPIRKNSTSGKQYLALEYTGEHLSIIDMEINADFNAVIRPQSSAVITEVYVDSTKATVTTLTVKITNSGLLSNSFMVRISDIPLEMAQSFQVLQSKITLISPQNQHIFKLVSKDLVLPVDIFYCSIEVLSPKGELLALRRIRIQKADRCICTWHCLCACVGSIEGLKCRPMSLQHYHAAGFQGALPMVTYMEHYTIMDDVLSVIMYLLFFIVMMLLLLGITKAAIGLCAPSVGYWGLNVLLDLPKPLNQYYESYLRGHPVIYDEEGWPIHPDTRERVRNIGYMLMCLINTFFFFTYPPTVTSIVMKRLCCRNSKQKCERVPSCSGIETCTNENCRDYQEVEVVMQVSEYENTTNVMRKRYTGRKEDTIMEEIVDEQADEEEVEAETSRKSSTYKREYKSSIRSTSKGATSEEGTEEDETTDKLHAQPTKGTQYNIDIRTTDTSRSTSPTNMSKECLCDHGSSI